MARTYKTIFALIFGLGVVGGISFAGTSTGAPAAIVATPVRTSSLLPPLSQPNWDQLTQEQRSVLKPLASEWPTMESYRRKKWIGIAQRYATMSAEEKLRVDQRMKDWASLTPDQRRQARANYKSLKQVAPDHKEDIKRKWEEYSQLPAEQRQQLKAEAARKPTAKPLLPLTQPLPSKTAPLPKAGGMAKSIDAGVSPAPTGEQAPATPAPKPTSSMKP